MDKIILVNKEKGMTSFDVVSKCRRIFHEKRIGHTGTLDPEATGLLIILVGKCTKLLPYCVKDHKHYKATFSFGKKTDTEDIWGTTVDEKTPKYHSLEELQEVTNSFLGHIKQCPPMYSAIKKDGKKLYELARKGIEVERELRDAYISKMEIKQVGENDFQLDAIVSSGTYIRTLIQDFGKKLDEFATMTSLVRIQIENLSLKRALTINQLELGESLDVNLRDVIDPSIPFIETTQINDIMNGKKIKLECDAPRILFVSLNKPLAIYKKECEGIYCCERGLF